jgi:Cys-rich repeat protein
MDCPAARPTCNPQNGRCVQCLVNAQCDVGQTCVAHGCVDTCNSNADCSLPTPVCDLTKHLCAERTKNMECGVAKPICDTTVDRCVECVLDADCPPGQACDAGTCG